MKRTSRRTVRKCISFLLACMMLFGMTPAWAETQEIAPEEYTEDFLPADNGRKGESSSTGDLSAEEPEDENDPDTGDAENTEVTDLENVDTVISENASDSGTASYNGQQMVSNDEGENVRLLSSYGETQTENSVISAQSGESIFYFDSVSEAFDAAGSDLTGDLTFALLKDTEYENTAEKVAVFSGVGNVTLDLNGHSLTVSNTTASSSDLDLNASSFTLKDSQFTGDVLQEKPENGVFFQNVRLTTTSGSAAESVSFENIRLDFDNTSNGIYIPAGVFHAENAVFSNTNRDSTNYVLTISKGGNLTNCVIEGTRGISVSGDVTISESIVEASEEENSGGIAVAINGNTVATIDGGSYSGETVINAAYSTSSAILQDGTFDGKITAGNRSASIEIRNGWYRGEWTGSGTVSAPHSIASEGTGEYEGFTKYTLRDAYTAKITLSGESRFASIDTGTGEQTVYADEDIVYEVICRDDFVVSKITYTPEGGTPQEVEKTETNGQTTIYRMTVPEGDYSLDFEIQAEPQGEDVVSVNGEYYDSLTLAMDYLAAGDTLRLEKDITYSSVLSFDKENVTLDLNGKKLNMQVSDTDTYAYSIEVAGGGLTVKDSAEDSGTISFGGKNGILVSGEGAKFELMSGSLTDLASYTAHSTVSVTGAEGEVRISGGNLEGTVRLDNSNATAYITGGTLEATGPSATVLAPGNGTCYISGGTLTSGDKVTEASDATPTISARGATIVMTGGTVISELNVAPFDISGSTFSGTIEISGDSEIISEKTAAIAISARLMSGTGTLKIGDSAALQGATFTLTFTGIDNDYGLGQGYADVQITGGYFSCGEDYIPINDTSHVTFTEGYVLDTEISTEKDGFYTLATKDSLAGTNPETGQSYTYQDFEGTAAGGYGGGLNQLLESAAEYDNSGSSYPDDAWQAFSNAYEAAQSVKTNANANQMEIDYRASELTRAMQVLDNMTDLDVTNLADGTYSMEIELYKTSLTGPSMASGALNGAALLEVKDGKITMNLNFKPTFTSGLWGHLLQFWVYDGATPAQAETNSLAGENGNATEASYSNYYAHVGESSGTDEIEYRLEEEGADGYSEDYPYPGTVTFEMPYVGSDSEYSTLYCRVGVDAMREIADEGISGDANVLAMLKWSTLTEMDVEPTLRLSTDNVAMLIGTNETVTANLISAEGYEITSWESSDDTVAAADTAETGTAVINAVGEGSCIVTVTASNGTEELTGEIAVTVAPSGSRAVKVDSVTFDADSATADITLSGDVLVTNNKEEDRVSTNISSVLVNGILEENGANVERVTVTIPSVAAQALSDRNTTIQTDLGNISLNRELMAQAVSSEDSVQLSIRTADVTSLSDLGRFTDAYELTLQDSAGRDLDFGEGSAEVTVPCSDEVSYVYCVDNDRLTERLNVTYNEETQTATWTTDHFSLWALSSREYAVSSGGSGNPGGSGGSGGGSTPSDEFFLEDGNYYVDIALWKADSDEQSMGNVAFKNNDRALITVKNGEVTTVRIATNPVDVDQYHSAITSFVVDNADVTVLSTGKVTTEPAGVEYDYIESVEFQMPEEGQPEYSSETTYVAVTFWVPDTPMDSAVGDELHARLKFTWSTAEATDDTSLEQDSSTGSGTSSITGETITDVTLTDSSTGIRLETNTERLSDAAQMTVTRLTEGDAYDTAVSAMEDIDGEWSLYQIQTSVNGTVTAPEGSVTLSFPCGEEELTIYRISDSGQRTVLRGEVKNGYYVINTSSLGLFAVMGDISDEIPPAETEEGSFTDMQDHWAKEYVDFVVERGLFNGVSDTEFSPNTSMTRGMFVTAVGRLAGVGSLSDTDAEGEDAESEDAGSGTTDFTDVSADSWYAPYVAWAAENGIVSGTTDTTFEPDRAITRQEMATLLSRYAEFAKIELTEGDTVTFTDSDEISDYAKAAVEAMASAGLIQGMGDGTFAPRQTATRAEVATLLARFMQEYSL